jgi:hypothetical protein
VVVTGSACLGMLAEAVGPVAAARGRARWRPLVVPVAARPGTACGAKPAARFMHPQTGQGIASDLSTIGVRCGALSTSRKRIKSFWIACDAETQLN